MPFEILNNLVNMEVDAVVNTANPICDWFLGEWQVHAKAGAGAAY